MNLNAMRRFGAWMLALVLTLTVVVIPAAAAGGYTVTLSETTLSMTLEDDRIPLKATVKDGETTILSNVGADTAKHYLSWFSEKPEVATVNEFGGVEAKGEGTTTITATYTDDAGKTGSATCTVKVTRPPVPVTDLDFESLPAALSVGDSVELKALVTPGEATEALKWSITGTSGVIGFSPNGRTCTVTAKKPGEATVKVETEDGRLHAECTVKVSGIVLDETSLRMLTGDSKTLAARSYGNAPIESSIVWSSSNISVAEVIDGRVIGHYPGTATIKAEAGAYQATCTVTVEEDVAEAIKTSLDAGAVMPFSNLLSDLKSRSVEKTESTLSYISSLQVSSSQGALYYGYISSDNPGTGVGGESYYVNPGNGQLDMKKIFFVANPDFSGTAIISYTGRGSNGRNFNGTIRVSVAAADDVFYSTSANQPVYFKTADFSSVCIAKTGREISSIAFLQPSSRAGVLYYNYGEANLYNPEVSRSVSFYRTKSPYLDDVVFVPNEDYSGTVDITYYCTTSAGTHTGKVTIEVSEAEQIDDGRITYDVASGGYVDLDVDDFNWVCRDLTGSSLSYIYFDLPSAAEGTLYYNHVSGYNYGSLVSETTRYFRSSNPKISNITFVAPSNYTGDVSVTFTGYSTSGETFTGEVVFRVDGHDGVITYHSNYGEEIRFDGTDFNELCLDVNGRKLNYVSFEQPRSSCGTLYRSPTSHSRAKLSSSTKFYRSGGSYQIDDVVLVPNSSYVGTFNIPFSGYDVSGRRINGVVQITVGRQPGNLIVNDPGVVSYLGSSLPIQLKAADFERVYKEFTGRPLSYIRFANLPTQAEGKLYLNYQLPMQAGTAVKANTNYYVGASPSIGQITFVPKAGYQGTMMIPFSGVDTSGRSVTCTLRMDVSNWYLPNHFTDMTGYDMAKPSVEFLYDIGVARGYGNGTYGPGKSISRGEFTVMVYRAFELPDTGNIYSFRDVAADRFYAPAIAAAKAQGIVQGYGSDFKPESTITRQDAMTIVLRAMEAMGRSVPNVSTSILASYADGSQVGSHARVAVSTMVYLGAVDVNAAQQIRPYAPLTRAEMAVMLHHMLTQ